MISSSPEKSLKDPRIAQMGLFASTFASTGQNWSPVTLPVYLPHPIANASQFTFDPPKFPFESNDHMTRFV